MSKRIWAILTLMLLCFGLFSCSNRANAPAETGTSGADPETDIGTDTGSSATNKPAPPVQVDLLLFMGATDMAGRGGEESTVECAEGHAYEFRAISDPTKLYPMSAEFGRNENKTFGIDDGEEKTGSMVPAFCESYYATTQTPVIAVSASEGNTGMQDWTVGNGRMEDAVDRLNAAVSFIRASETFEVRHIFMIWCQGEADVAAGTDVQTYISRTQALVSTMMRFGVEKCLLIQTGNDLSRPAESGAIREAQAEMCEKNEAMILISVLFSGLSGMQKASGGYLQEAYDMVGADAGKNAGNYVMDPDGYRLTAREPEEENQYNGTVIDLPVDSWD